MERSTIDFTFSLKHIHKDIKNVNYIHSQDFSFKIISVKTPQKYTVKSYLFRYMDLTKGNPDTELKSIKHPTKIPTYYITIKIN